MKQRGQFLVDRRLALSASAIAQTPPFALKPRAPTGFSGPEQRYVYAPPDEGSFRVSLVTGQAAPTEVSIAEPSMCEGSAQATIRYSKKRNEVVLDADFKKALPYRMTTPGLTSRRRTTSSRSRCTMGSGRCGSSPGSSASRRTSITTPRRCS